MGAFGPCAPNDVHAKRPCPCCKGKGHSKHQLQCPSCQGKGGHGAFGPCESSDVHFKHACEPCTGNGWM